MAKVKFRPELIKKADKLIARYMSGELYPRKMYLKDRLSIDVDRRHRLYSRDNGKTWELLTHEDYNTMITRKK